MLRIIDEVQGKLLLDTLVFLPELLLCAGIVVLSILLGVAPNLLLSWMAPSVTGLVKALSQLTMQ